MNGAARERGFTLIETMWGIVLLTLGVVAMAGVFPQGLALGVYARDQTKATALAQQKIDHARSRTYYDLVPIDYYATSWYLAGFIWEDFYNYPGVECRTYNGVAVGGPSCWTNPTTYFQRTFQVQCYVWSNSADPPRFVYTVDNDHECPPAGVAAQGLWRMSVIVFWKVRGQTSFVGTGATRGCLSGGSAVSAGMGCVQVSTSFVAPPLCPGGSSPQFCEPPTGGCVVLCE